MEEIKIEEAEKIKVPKIKQFFSFLHRNKLIVTMVLCTVAIIFSTFFLWTKLTAYFDNQFTLFTSNVSQQQNLDGTEVPNAESGEPVDVAVSEGSVFLGNENASVTVIEFADYQCPFCKKFFTDTFPKLKSTYIDSGKVKFYYQDFAFLGSESTRAAEASQCALDQNKFWEYHDTLYKNQGAENSGAFSDQKLIDLGKNSGLDVAIFEQCLSNKKYLERVNQTLASAKNYGVSGTPTVFINGKRLVGALPFTSYEKLIEEALK